MKIINTLLLIALCLSCDDQALENNQVPTIVIDVDNDSRQFVDSGNDAGMVQDMTNDVTIPAPTIFPLAPGNIKKATEENDGKEFYTALLPTTDNTEKLIVPHYNDVFSESRVVSNRLADESFETLSIQGTLVGSLSVVEFNEKTYLYYGSSDNLDAAFTTYRMEWDGDGFLDAEAVYQFGSLLNWPRFVVREDEVWVVYRDNMSRTTIMKSTDGLNFDRPKILYPWGIAQPEAAVFKDGTVAVTYQEGDNMGIMDSYFILSQDAGETWTEQKRVTQNNGNVHDTDLFPRADGGVDMYYVYPDSNIGFALWRRCLKKDGTLGVEEKLLGSDWGSVVKPKAHRSVDDQIILSFANQRGGHLAHYTRIWGDAVCDE